MNLSLHLVLQAIVQVVVTAKQSNIAEFLPQDAFLLPEAYIGGTAEQVFLDTQVASSTLLNKSLGVASDKPFISFDQEFSALLGRNPAPHLVEKRKNQIWYEAAVWDPVHHDVWFTSNAQLGFPLVVHIYNLDDQSIRKPKLSAPVVNPNGGYYFQGKIYLTTWGNDTFPGGVVAVDPKTHKAETIVNTYFGLRFNGPDDICWARINGKSYMYFTDPAYAYYYNQITLADQNPGMTWRFDPQAQILNPMISREDIPWPNGIRVSRDQKLLYVTDGMPATGFTSKTPANSTTGSPAVYLYDLNSDGRAINRRVFSYARAGIVDGLHIDDAGRVWTGEGDGVVVRNSQGKVLGFFNRKYFDPKRDFPIANFALAGDTLVIAASQKLWTVKLTEMVVSKERCVSVGC